jgi:predicted O-methyltransferase YrrM
MLTVNQYDAIFEKERRRDYPIVDAYERMHGYAIERDKLESMARTLACPLKANPPNWQHGRVIYTTLRFFLRKALQGFVGGEVILDIGTAKGFSACVISHALEDSGAGCEVVSLDVIDPNARVSRNSAAELDGLKTIDEFVAGHVASGVRVTFFGGGSNSWLEWALQQNKRVPFAFVDGKHTYEQVRYEATALSQLQRPGDVVIFDDCQIEPVGRAVRETKMYSTNYVDIGPRTYAIGIRK